MLLDASSPDALVHCPFLFFERSPPPPHPPSFPTRRSSDLTARRRDPPAPPRPCAAARAATSRSGPSRPRSASTTAQDRKSTRLNSSHRCISYAVFCLKKKRTEQPALSRAPHSAPDQETAPL